MMKEILDGVTPVLIEEKPAVVYADILNHLDPVLCSEFFPKWKEAGLKIIVKASTVADAITAEKYGADIVVAKGWEGGGHVTPESTMVILRQISSTVSIPVIGSGGIADGRGMAAAIMLGADAIEMGTAFLCATENDIHDNAKKAIIEAQDMRSVITGTCTHEPCRQLSNSFSDEMTDLEMNHSVAEVADKIREMAGPSLKKGMHDGDVENGAVMAGMIAPLIKEIRLAKDIIDSVIAGCKDAFDRCQQYEF